MSKSRRPDDEEEERQKKAEKELQLHDFGQRNSHRSQSRERSNSRTKSSHKSQEETKLKLLNPYGLSASTVPPFALDEQLKMHRRQGTQNQDGASQIVKDPHKQNDLKQQQQCSSKDPFLVSHNDNWDQFVENIGSNVAYLHKAAEDNETGSAPEGASSSSSKTETTSSFSEDTKHFEKNRRTASRTASKDIFANLDDSWGGSERLNAIFNGPLLDSNKFTNNQDRQDWSDYLESVKAFYYRDGGLENPDLEAGVQAEDPTSNGDNNKLQAFLEKQKLDFKQKRKHWRQLERQKKQKWLPTLRKLMLDNQYLPLGFRMSIVILSIIALGLAIRIFQNSNSRVEVVGASIPQQASTVMAICVNSIAVLYLFYIAYDEFSGKPLGLRNPFGKLRLILLDLLFIIFSSANLALTFNTLYDKQWVCTAGEYTKEQLPKIDYICRKQRALASFLFVMLFLWVTTFSISILRVVEKMNSSSPR
ncbi:LAFA_0G22298g1_1 [Lachancea sp. 'fantastica']|nr:LAFA_0G22298g1_1 [Lachancea sp. 'fantastica']